MTGCPGNYQYYRQPPTTFTDCNPVRTSLQLLCTVLVPSDSTTVTVDWYWSKNISECERNITEEQGRFTIVSSRKASHIANVDRIKTDLTIKVPRNDTGYYWCKVNDSSYNGVFISSNKAPVFNTGTMTNCDDRKQSTIKSNCVVGSVPLSLCVVPTKTTTFSPATSYELNFITTIVIPVQNTTTAPSIPLYVISTTNTGNSTVPTSTRPTETLKIKEFSQLTYMSSIVSLSYDTPSVISLGSCCDNEGLISGLVVLSIVMFGLGGVLGGLLTVLWNKWRCSKGICHMQIFNTYHNSLDGKNSSRKEIRLENYYSSR